MIYPLAPRYKITTNYDGDAFAFETSQFLSGRVIMHENGFDTATVLCNDYESLNYLSKVAKGEDIKIELKDRGDASWKTLFDGIVRFIDFPFSIQGELLVLKCDGTGYGFAETVCGDEYGTESKNAGLDTLKDIVTDSTNGIVPNWVNKILGGATSGHNYTMEVEDIAGSIKYLYFPYVPCAATLRDVLDTVQAIKGTNAGPHFIVNTSGKLIVTTLGTHHAGAVSAGWPTFYGGTRATATIEQKKDILAHVIQDMTKEANYILYHGKFFHPAKKDIYTELNADDWAEGFFATADDDVGTYRAGTASIDARNSGCGGSMRDCQTFYPDIADVPASGLNLDLESVSGEFNAPTYVFWVKPAGNLWGNARDIEFRLYTTNRTTYFKSNRIAVQDVWPTFGSIWKEFNLPVGPNYKLGVGKGGSESWFTSWMSEGSPSWSNIDAIGFIFTSDQSNDDNGVEGINFDGAYFTGYLLRAAREASIGASNKLKVKVITDNVAKYDTLVASDDSGTIGRLAYAELLRSQTAPKVGWVKTPIIMGLLPGQFLHVHAKQKSKSGTCAICSGAGTFNIASDFRVTRVIHDFSMQGFITTSEVTDDVKNSVCRPSFTDMNRIWAAARPEYQDRQAMSIKTRDIDVTQPILTKSY